MLRVLDGAQETYVYKHVGLAAGKVVAADPANQIAVPAELHAYAMAALAVGLTVVFAGGFAALSQYFRSERVKEQITSLDRLDSVE